MHTTANALPTFKLAEYLANPTKEQNPSSQAESRSASQEILHLVRYPKVNYRVH
jgi:hypothetical protein